MRGVLIRRWAVGILLACIALANVSAGSLGIRCRLALQVPISSWTMTQTDSDLTAGARRRLLRDHPELMGVLKSYLAQRLRSEGKPADEQSITDSMLYARIQSDPAFAKDASQRLISLAQATAESLRTPSATDSQQDLRAQAEPAAIDSSKPQKASTQAQAALPHAGHQWRSKICICRRANCGIAASGSTADNRFIVLARLQCGAVH